MAGAEGGTAAKALIERVNAGGIKRALGRGLAFLGAGAVASSLALAWARYQAAQAELRLPKEFILELDLSRLRVTEQAPTGVVQIVQGAGRGQIELRKVVKALGLAGKDERVRGLLAQLGPREHLGGLATIQELRGAVDGFRRASAGRNAVTIAHSPAYGEAGSNGTLQYYLASAFGAVHLQPSGTLGLLGLQSQLLFFRGLLDKLKVEPIFYTREQYKTAAHALTQRDFTAPHRENVDSILQDLVSQLWTDIASARTLTATELAGAVEAAPLLAPQAQNHRLADGLLYLDQVTAQLKKSPALLKQEQEEGNKGVNQAKHPSDDRLPRVPLSKYLLVKELSEGVKRSGSAGWLTSGPWAGLLPASWRTSPTGDNVRHAPPHVPAPQPALNGAPAVPTLALGMMQAQADLAPGVAKAMPPGPTSGKPFTAETAGWVSPSLGGGRPKVAVVHAVGTIVQGPVTGPPGGAPGQQVIDATKLAGQLHKLAKAEDVAAVVLRVTSPGGSALGSDTLHHALLALKEAGKKLVVSCGDVAASGGMFLAVAGDRIVAQPATLTGSIGVITGKVDASGLLAEVGINPASVEHGSPNLTLLSPFTRPNEQQEATINRLMDSIYGDFLAKVAAGRKLSLEAVRALAGGRVYTGQQAQQAGLVDELGGLKEAIKAAKKLAGLPAEEEQVVTFEYPPKRVPLFVRLLQSMGPSVDPSADPTEGGPGASHAAVQAAALALGQWHAPARAAAVLPSVSSPALQRQLQAAQGALGALAALDGVSCFSLDAQLLNALLS